MLRTFRDHAPTSATDLLAAAGEALRWLRPILDRAGWEAEREMEALQEELIFLERWGTSEEWANLVKAAQRAVEAPQRERRRNWQKTRQLIHDLRGKAQCRATEFQSRLAEEQRLFGQAALLKQPPQVEERLYMYHPELRSIAAFQPLDWIPAPPRMLRLESRVRAARRNILAGASQRLRRAIRFNTDITPIVLPRFEFHKGRRYLTGRVEAAMVSEVELPPGSETVNGLKRLRPGRLAYYIEVSPVRARVREVLIDQDKTDALSLPLQRFLDDPDWALAFKAGLLDIGNYNLLTQQQQEAAPKDALAEIVRLLQDWGYTPAAIRAKYWKLALPAKLSQDEKAARISEAIDADRRRVEEEIREAMSTTETKPARVSAGPADTPTDDEEELEIPSDVYVVGILGPVGTGKTATGHEAMEGHRNHATPYVVLYAGMERPASLPPRIRVTYDLESIPADSNILLDEAPLLFGARECGTTAAKLMIKWIGLIRQRRQVLFVVSRLGSEVDKVLMAHSDLIVVKKPLAGTSTFERPLLRLLLDQAEAAFARIEGDPRCYSYVWNRRTGTKRMLRNGLPSYWTDELSRCFASASLVPAGARK